jgi:hypothetical protein
MNKEIVLYTEALSLRDLGFKENCFGFYNIAGTFVPDYNVTIENINKLELKDCCLAPTYLAVLKWFREVHHIDGWVVPYHTLRGQRYGIMIEGDNSGADQDSDFESFEEAELHLVQLLIKILIDHNTEAEWMSSSSPQK